MIHYQKETKPFILQTAILSICLLCYLPILFFCLGRHYPESDELEYETYTYSSYEYKSVGRASYRYYVFAEECDSPLIIGNIAQRGVNDALLQSLRQGENVTVSLKDGELLYEISARGDDILSYEDYLHLHRKNDLIGIIFTALASAIHFTVLVIGIVHYKKTGKAFKGFS